MALHVYRDLVDLCTVSDLPATAGVKSVEHYLLSKENPFHFMEDGQVHNNLILDRCAIPVYDGSVWREVTNPAPLTFDALTAGDGTFSSFQVGGEYYVYITIDGVPSIVTSLNSTYPQGSTANTSRRIGKFTYANGRRVSDDGSYAPVNGANVIFGASWQGAVYQGILPNCIQDLVNRPVADFGAMCQIGPHGHGWWACKYQLSSDNITLGPTYPTATPAVGVSNTSCWNASNTSSSAVLAAAGEQGHGTLISQYGRVPITGQEGLCRYNFDTLVARTGGRLPSWSEWISMAYGSPNGQNDNNYAWTAPSNTNRCRTGAGVEPTTGLYSATSGQKPMAVSAWNLDDCVGNLSDWGSGAMYVNTTFKDLGLALGGDYYEGTLATDRRVIAVVGSGLYNNVGARAVSDAA